MRDKAALHPGKHRAMNSAPRLENNSFPGCSAAHFAARKSGAQVKRAAYVSIYQRNSAANNHAALLASSPSVTSRT
jgi:hypothetical protein